jgi:hypothetical protein
MAEEESTQVTEDIPAVEAEEETATSPWQAHEASKSGGRPEVLLGAAFAGGFVVAKLLKRIGGGD